MWSDPLAPALAQVLPSKCCNAQTAHRAAQTARDLAIPYRILDLENDFKRTVVDPFLEGYRRGLTPNPCIGCNRTIKFGKLIDLMHELGCDRLATGHYARVAVERMADGTQRHVLLEAADATKDQSYYLYGLQQEQLRHCVFPLGSMLKKDVYALAKHYGVPLPDGYRESQDLCFFPEKTPQDFLRRHLQPDLKPGPIERRDGTVVGTHDGVALYTVGQRRGLKVGGLRVPLEVVAKDVGRNALIVEDKGIETLTSVRLTEMRFVAWRPADDNDIEFECRVRSFGAKRSGRLTVSGDAGEFRFDSPIGPQASGQSLVLYRGKEIVGGGVMHGN